MILDVSSRTDIPQYYSKWLLKRFEEGYVYVRNPMFPEKVSRIELKENLIDCITFVSKNYKPLIPDIHRITDHYNTYFFYTITGYKDDIEPNVPSIDESIDTLMELSNIVGRDKVAWRYDPVLYTSYYNLQYHKQCFEYITEKVNHYIDRCIFSFVDLYKKLERNMPEIIPFTIKDKEDIARNLGKIADRYNMKIQSCASDVDYGKYNIIKGACRNLDLFGNANNIKFKDIKHKGDRLHCHCIDTRDIGQYDTCLNGCKYCYANTNPKKAFENIKYHDPNSPILIGNIRENDIVTKANQKSFLKKPYRKPDKNETTLDKFF